MEPSCLHFCSDVGRDAESRVITDVLHVVVIIFSTVEEVIIIVEIF